MKGLPPSATLAINERSNAMLAEGHRIYKFGLGQSPFPVPPQVVAALQSFAGEKDYLPVRGLRALQESVAGYLKRQIEVDRPAAQVIIGPGSKELMFITQLVYEAELLVPNPSWVSYVPQARLLGRPHTWLPTDQGNGWKLTPDTLDAHCTREPGRAGLLILNYPSNPTGVTFNAAELQALAVVARKHGVLVVSDEIYGHVDHDGNHTSIASHYPEGTIISTGLSKWAGAGGWRLGVYSLPKELEWLAKAMSAVASETFTSVSAPIQHASITAFDGSPEITGYLRDCRRILSALGGYCAARLRDAGASVAEPEGGFYLFPDFSPLQSRMQERGISSSTRLTESLLSDTGVACGRIGKWQVGWRSRSAT